MAANYIVQSQTREVQVVAAGTSLDVMTVGATTLPHGVYFQVNIPYLSWQTFGQQAALGDFIEPTAAAIEAYLGAGEAVAATWDEIPDESGLLEGVIEFTVAIDTPVGRFGPMTTTVQVPIGILGADPAIRNAVVEPMFQQAVADLTATANL